MRRLFGRGLVFPVMELACNVMFVLLFSPGVEARNQVSVTCHGMNPCSKENPGYDK